MISDTLSEALYIVGGYVLLFVVMIVSINHLQRGAFLAWFKVRMSRGKKILVDCRTPLERYYVVGEIVESRLQFKNKKNDSLLFEGIKPEMVQNTLGVQLIEVDLVNNWIYTRGGLPVMGNDPQEVDALFNRCLKKPADMDMWQKIAVFAIIVLVIFAIVSIFMQYNSMQEIARLAVEFAEKTTPTGVTI